MSGTIDQQRGQQGGNVRTIKWTILAVTGLSSSWEAAGNNLLGSGKIPRLFPISLNAGLLVTLPVCDRLTVVRNKERKFLAKKNPPKKTKKSQAREVLAKTERQLLMDDLAGMKFVVGHYFTRVDKLWRSKDVLPAISARPVATLECTPNTGQQISGNVVDARECSERLPGAQITRDSRGGGGRMFTPSICP
ncbi:hypothetical protein RRG08_001871 [Elysia crispata]|uniref:Uncharacterized protein n=1 Tax=Elysia crispata TaxID=231223 RepID=A0AAE1DRW4_9GAST|nr:hypothetical protein RRG08_001871 [Elysia crispata]